MSSVTAFEAKTRFGDLLERVARGEEVVITRHDKPVARMIPEGGKNLRRVQGAVTALENLRQIIRARTRGKKPLTYAEVRSAIEAGRE